MLKFERPYAPECKISKKMATRQEDFLYEDDFDAVLAAIAADDLENIDEFDESINNIIDEIPKEANPTQYHCNFCEKICISQRGLTRHKNAKHGVKQQQSTSTATSTITQKAEEIMTQASLKNKLEKSASKLAVNECYPIEVMEQFKNFKIHSLDEITALYDSMKSILCSFNHSRDLEKFYPKFMQLFNKENFFPHLLSINCNKLLGMELQHHIVCHITGSSMNENVVNFENVGKTFTERQKSIIAYLSGYVFGTMYRRIRFSKLTHNSADIYHRQCLSFLIAGKCVGEKIKLPEHKIVEIHDRGGLWKVTKDVIDIFSKAEAYFLLAVEKNPRKIDSQDYVPAMLKDVFILHLVSKIKHKSSEVIKKEIVLNLLSDMLTLYFRVRAFSYAKDKVEMHKIRKKQTKARSLRTSMKKASSTLDQGH